MRDVVHLYRLTDCMSILRNSGDPVLLVLCNDPCQLHSGQCGRRGALADLNRDGLLIAVVHQNELPDILNVYKGLAWGHAVLLRNVRMVEHWTQLPTPEQLAEAMSKPAD